MVLTGCTNSIPGYAIFDRPDSETVRLPASLPSYAMEEADVDTLRYVDDYEGASLWLAKRNSVSGVCLLVYLNGEDWSAICGDQTGPLGASGYDWSFTVLPSDAPAPEGLTAISENVYAPAPG